LKQESLGDAKTVGENGPQHISTGTIPRIFAQAQGFSRFLSIYMEQNKNHFYLGEIWQRPPSPNDQNADHQE
jgi:hypothetical protein